MCGTFLQNRYRPEERWRDLKKNYVLDTNILLVSPEAMVMGFDDNDVWVTSTTLQELDRKKNFGGEVGYNAREACRILEYLRENGDLRKGVSLDNGGRLSVVTGGIGERFLLPGYSMDSPDNRIISACRYLMGELSEPVILVTNDVSMRINASICGVSVESYRNIAEKSSGYTGHADINVSNECISDFYKNGEVFVGDKAGFSELCENQFVTLHFGTSSALSVYQRGKLIDIGKQSLFGAEPKNRMQKYAAWALTRPAEEIPLVILSGPAGTAKTFLSLAAGLETTYRYGKKTNDTKYFKMLITRPNSQTTDQSFGYLPGDLDEKMEPLLAPYRDNLESLLMGKDKDADRDFVQTEIEDMFGTGIIEVCALSYIRGRSLMDCYMICDEAQNATRGLVKDIITRAGKGTKIVLCGDPGQIDNPTLDNYNNGLVYAIERMKGSPLCAVISFDASNSVRSPLAKDAIERLR